jgi:uncharacterized Rossmann fold enzyme
MDEELAFHLEKRVKELVPRGISRDDAARQAKIELGGTTALKEGMDPRSGYACGATSLPTLCHAHGDKVSRIRSHCHRLFSARHRSQHRNFHSRKAGFT